MGKLEPRPYGPGPVDRRRSGLHGGAALAGTVADAVLTFGGVTITLAATGIVVFLNDRRKRHKKGKELARAWRVRMGGL